MLKRISNMLNSIHSLISLQHYFYFSRRWTPWFSAVTLCLFIYGLYLGFFVAPKDAVQGDAFRIIYVHVPAAILSLFLYTIVFFNSVIFLVWRLKIADLIAAETAPVGLTFTLIALITGSIWGKPMWGTWWIWDARLTSELLLFFIYAGLIGLRSAIPNLEQSSKMTAILAIIGMVDIPIIHFSVEWWATLHQGATISKFAKPSMALEMLVPLIILLGAFFLFYVVVLQLRLQASILLRERKCLWVDEWLKDKSKNIKSKEQLHAIL